MLLEPTPARREGTPRKGREIYVTLACLWQGRGGGGKLRSFGINSTSQARLESYAWTHAVAPLSCATVRCRLPWLLAASLAATLKPNAGSAHRKGGQVMFHPPPLLELPCKAERWQGAHKRRTSNVSPSTITSAPWPRLAAGLLLNAGSALAKGRQIMFCPLPLLELPCAGAACGQPLPSAAH